MPHDVDYHPRAMMYRRVYRHNDGTLGFAPGSVPRPWRKIILMTSGNMRYLETLPTWFRPYRSLFEVYRPTANRGSQVTLYAVSNIPTYCGHCEMDRPCHHDEAAAPED